MKPIIILIFLLIILPSLYSADLIFTEIMYDPSNSDTGYEWLEIFNDADSSFNLSKIKFREGNTNHGLILIQGSPLLLPYSYAIITDDSSNFLSVQNTFNATVFDTSFTSGLSNSGEELTLIYTNNTNITTIFYNTSLGANGNNQTLCLLNNSWQSCYSTPGKINKIFTTPPPQNNSDITNITNTTSNNINIKIIPYPYSSIFINQNYDHFFKLIIENKDNCSLDDTIQVNYNITAYPNNLIKISSFAKTLGCSSYSSTGEFTPPQAENYTICAKIINSSITQDNLEDNSLCYNFSVIDNSLSPCDLSLAMNTDENIIYQQEQSIKFQPELNNDSFPFIIEYWIEDLFGNILKNKLNTTNTNKKSWKTDIEEQDRVLFIKSNLYSQCNDTNISNNYAEKMFIVTNNLIKTTDNSYTSSNLPEPSSSSQENQSSLKINKISPVKPSYGKLIKVYATIYKGSTSKYSLSAWAEQDSHKISEATSFHLNTKYQEYELTIPLQIKPNCDESHDNGAAEIILDGLGQKIEYSFNIEGLDSALCKYYASNNGKSSSQKDSSVKSENQSKKETSNNTTKTTKPPSTKKSSASADSASKSNTNSLIQPTYIFLNSSPPSELLASNRHNSPGFTVYESNSAKTKNIVPYLLIITSLIIGLILLKKNS